MSFCNKLLVSIGRCINVIVLILSVSLYGVAAKILSNVGIPLLSLAIANIFCGTVASITAILSIYTLPRRSKPAFFLSKCLGFVEIFMWFLLAFAHYVTRNYKILQASDPVEFQGLMRVTLYGCLVGCAAQIQVFVVSVILSLINGNADDATHADSIDSSCSYPKKFDCELNSTTKSIV